MGVDGERVFEEAVRGFELVGVEVGGFDAWEVLVEKLRGFVGEPWEGGREEFVGGEEGRG